MFNIVIEKLQGSSERAASLVEQVFEDACGSI